MLAGPSGFPLAADQSPSAAPCIAGIPQDGFGPGSWIHQGGKQAEPRERRQDGTRTACDSVSRDGRASPGPATRRAGTPRGSGRQQGLRGPARLCDAPWSCSQLRGRRVCPLEGALSEVLSSSHGAHSFKAFEKPGAAMTASLRRRRAERGWETWFSSPPAGGLLVTPGGPTPLGFSVGKTETPGCSSVTRGCSADQHGSHCAKSVTVGRPRPARLWVPRGFSTCVISSCFAIVLSGSVR